MRRAGLAALAAASASWAGTAWANGFAALGQLVLALVVGGGVSFLLGLVAVFWRNRIFFWVSLALIVPIVVFSIYMLVALRGEPFLLLPVVGAVLGLAGLVTHAVRFRRRQARDP